MHYFSIPTCYFPSTVLFIDDNRDFLLNFVLQLDEWLAYRIYDSPFDALDNIQKKQNEHQLLSQRCLSRHPTDAAVTPQQVFTALQTEMYNPHRFSDISVVVVDYAMPDMNGLDFCQRLNHTPIKKILLTGKADEEQVIKAFNEGLIDRYIHKSDPQVEELITRSIEELQWEYFQDMAGTITPLLANQSLTCLNDTHFVHFFRQFIREMNILEFYLADGCGSFLLLDADARLSFLRVMNVSQLQACHQLAREHGVNPLVLEPLARGEKIPCFWQPDKPEEAAKSLHLVPAKQIIGHEPYFYAHVTDPVLYANLPLNLFSYHNHLQEVDAEELLVL